ncbi:MAG TPA: zf-HC2 domain-containing protein [Casimicrobiaceae bacterium]|nr:zf-HC2 domain-containing protein [Casimicrobiaceae bacterium]
MTGRVVHLDPAGHRVADALLPWLVNGTLEGEELAFVQKHVDRCEACQREVEWLRELHAACAAAPGASSALSHLRRRLEEPRSHAATAAPLRSLWNRMLPWSQWAIAAELAVIIGLGIWLLPSAADPALYRTLGGRDVMPKSGSIVVVVEPTTTEAELRRILRDAGARIVDGPTQANAYVLDVPAMRQAQALQALRAEHALVLVERLDAQGTQ